MSFVVKIGTLPIPERKLMSEVISVCKLILVNPATSASVERRSFSTACPKIEDMVSLNNDTRAIYQLDNIKQLLKKEQTNTQGLL